MKFTNLLIYTYATNNYLLNKNTKALKIDNTLIIYKVMVSFWISTFYRF